MSRLVCVADGYLKQSNIGISMRKTLRTGIEGVVVKPFARDAVFGVPPNIQDNTISVLHSRHSVWS